MGKKTETKKAEGKKGVEKKVVYTLKHRSHTDKSKWYKISVTDDDIMCTCPDFVYRKQKKNMFCKHIFKAFNK